MQHVLNWMGLPVGAGYFLSMVFAAFLGGIIANVVNGRR
jgi:hypothetical protein